MIKYIFLITCIVIGSTATVYPYKTHSKAIKHISSTLYPEKIGLDLCPECINEAVELINVILGIVLNEGITQSCSVLCNAVANKTGSTFLGDLCDIACEAVGLDEFVKMIIKADIDPIYYCQLVHMCPIKDDGDAKFANFGVLPHSGPEGATFILDLSFITVNGTGTGTFTFNIIDPKNESNGDMYWFEAKKPGRYVEKFSIDTSALSHCDASTGKCNGMPLGVYNVTAQICNGECGSHHPHTSVYDAGRTSFILTKKH